MSRPRREWWSFLWSRRCCVRSLMRSVSSATWTRVLPVSCGVAPNCVTSSDLRSWVSGMRPANLAVEVVADGLDVAVHLLDQRVHGREPALAAQALVELDRQPAAVEIALEVDQEGLDELAAPGLELRPHANVDRRRATVGAARVDAVARDDVAVGRDEVRRGKAERAPALVPGDDRLGDLERRAEQLVGVLDRAAEDEAADVAGRDDLAVDLEQLDHADLEAPVGAQQVGVALRAVAEAEVLADGDVRRVQAADGASAGPRIADAGGRRADQHSGGGATGRSARWTSGAARRRPAGVGVVVGAIRTGSLRSA